MRKSYLITIAALALLLTTSCTEQQRSERVVASFLEEQLTDAEGLEIEKFYKIDSTRIISDSILTQLSKQALNSGHYKQNSTLSSPRKEKKLIISRVDYKLKGKTYQDTYYLDDDIEHVVAVKMNGR